MTTLKFQPTHSACISKPDLKRALDLLSKAVPKQPSTSIFTAVKVEICEGWVTFTSATSETLMEAKIPTTAPARTVDDSENANWALTTLPKLKVLLGITYSNEVCLHLSESGFAGSPYMFPNEYPDATVVDLSFNGFYRSDWLGYMDGKVANFPPLPSYDSKGVLKTEPATVLSEVSWKEASKILPWVMKAAPSKDIRYYLNGLCIDSKASHCNFVGTDGHRLHRWTDDRTHTKNLKGYVTESEAIWPYEHFQLLKAFIREGVKLSSKGQIGENLRFRLHDDVILTSFYSDDLRLQVAVKKINGTYPTYSRVIPDLSTRTTRLELSNEQASSLSKTLKDITPEGKALLGFVKMFSEPLPDLRKDDGVVKFLCNHVYRAGDGSADTRLTAEFKAEVTSKSLGTGLNPAVALNKVYLADALDVSKVTIGAIEFFSREGSDNTVVVSGDCMAVVMPLRA